MQRAGSRTSATATAKAAAKKADGESSASQVVGGSYKPARGPSPEDEEVVARWRAEGKLHVLEGAWCCVPYKVTVVPAAGGDAAVTQRKAQELLDGIAAKAEEIFSHFAAHSEVSAINALPANVLHEVSTPMRKVLEMANTVNRMTRGAFDPAVVLPVSQYHKNNAHRDDLSDAGGVAATSRWNMFQLSQDGLVKTQDGAALNLCGLAKGWAIDEMSACLKEHGFVASYLDWGGDIKVSGQHPVGRNWTAAILEPPAMDANGMPAAQGEKTYLAHVELRDGQSIATSGDYAQLLAPGLSHIVDPKAGAPIEISGQTLASVSVVCASCMLADALATAAMAMGKVAAGRRLLDGFRGSCMNDPLTDYLLYAREGPRLVRMRAPTAELPEHREERLSRHLPAHVVVVGGGLAGVSAAIQASQARAQVTLLEKEPACGGNSAKATSGINACGTRVQYKNGVEDDGRYFERDTHVSAVGGRSDIGCVSMLAGKSAEAIHWLIDDVGVDLSVLTQLGGHARKRTHRVPPRSDGTPVPVGFTIMQHARAAVESIPTIEVKHGCTVTGLIEHPERKEVQGVAYVDEAGVQQTLLCDAVVLTTGGFGYDKSEGSLMAKFRPDLLGVPTTNGSFANGDAIRFGHAIGANLIDMEKVQLHPTAFIDPRDPGNHTKYLGPEALRGSGGILLDQQGRRFVNELDLRSVVSQHILDKCDPWKNPDGTVARPWAWCVLNEASQEKFGRPMLMFYKDQVGLFEAAEGAKGIAEVIGCSEENVVETLREYREACDAKICRRTGKAVFPSRVTENDRSFVLGRITPCIHYCMGGLEISTSGEVLTTTSASISKQSPISPRPEAEEAQKGTLGKRAKVGRLFAAGECTGGVHGENRLGGNSLLECVVFGRLAGERAATIKQPRPTLLDTGEWQPVQLSEIRNTDAKFGHNTQTFRFNLHSSLQTTGLEVGRFVAIRGELDGDTLTGYYSPISRPGDVGVIDILCRTDEKGGPIVKLLQSIRPGASVLMKAMGGVRLVQQPTPPFWSHNGRPLRRLSLLAGGTGVAPALQISRAFFKNLATDEGADGDAHPSAPERGIKIVYAAETVGDLAFMGAIENLEARFRDLIQHYVVLNLPPQGWTQGIGFVDQDIIRRRLWFPPADDHMMVICGPPIFEQIMCSNLSKLGYPKEQYYSFAADSAAAS